MPHRNLTPDTVFKPSAPPGSEPVFAFANSEALDCEQDQYKQLIKAELVRQGLPPAHLADRMQIPRPKLHKILKQNTPLSDTMRDQIFAELGIDDVRARFSVALLRDYRAYSEKSAFVAVEGLKSLYLELKTCRRGAIDVDLRPAIIHEAVRRAYDLLLSHQDRVMQNDQTLQA